MGEGKTVRTYQMMRRFPGCIRDICLQMLEGTDRFVESLLAIPFPSRVFEWPYLWDPQSTRIYACIFAMLFDRIHRPTVPAHRPRRL